VIKRIILHWTAGKFYPTEYEKQFYHYLVDVQGKIHNGIYKPEDNLDCKDGRYAAHTGGGNTGSVGVALCAMSGFRSPKQCGSYLISPIQFEACMNLCARLCQKYKLEVNESTVMTHYEFGLKNPATTSAGKTDITYLPPYPWVTKKDAGSFIRTKIRWYLNKNLKG